jgi:hypothetical protein
MLSAGQRAEFEERGLLRLPGFVDAKIAAELRDQVHARMRERALVPDPRPPGFLLHPSRLASLTKRRSFASFWGEGIAALVDDLLGAGRWHPPEDAGQILSVSFPSEERWVLPHKMWHLDYMAPAALTDLPGLQLFACVDRIEPRGGGTLVACGTHRLIDALRRREGSGWEGRSADVRGRLKASVPWLRELCSLREGEDRDARFLLRATPFEGTSLEVVELVGEAGDAYAMHPWILHSLSRNCGARPRLALTQRLHARRL